MRPTRGKGARARRSRKIPISNDQDDAVPAGTASFCLLGGANVGRLCSHSLLRSMGTMRWALPKSNHASTAPWRDRAHKQWGETG